MRNDNLPFNSRIQRDRFLKMKFEESGIEKSERGAMSFQIKMESEFPGITRLVEVLDGKQGRNIEDVIKDIYEIP